MGEQKWSRAVDIPPDESTIISINTHTIMISYRKDARHYIHLLETSTGISKGEIAIEGYLLNAKLLQNDTIICILKQDEMKLIVFDLGGAVLQNTALCDIGYVKGDGEPSFVIDEQETMFALYWITKYLDLRLNCYKSKGSWSFLKKHKSGKEVWVCHLDGSSPFVELDYWATGIRCMQTEIIASP